MGPVKITMVQYYFSAKCVGFEPFDKAGPVICKNNPKELESKFLILDNTFFCYIASTLNNCVI